MGSRHGHIEVPGLHPPGNRMGVVSSHVYTNDFGGTVAPEVRHLTGALRARNGRSCIVKGI